MLMIPYSGGTYRVVIGSIWVFQCMWKRQEAIEWDGDPELCMRAVRDYDAAQDCEVCEE